MTHNLLNPTLTEQQNYLDIKSLILNQASDFSPLRIPQMGITLTSAGSMIPQEEGLTRRGDFLKSVDMDLQLACHNHQTHTKIVHTVSGSPLKGEEGDGFVTVEPGWILTATAADCMPIFLFDPVTMNRGLVHSGWAGTGISMVAVEKMIALGSKKDDLFAVMGPSIGSCCYLVDSDRWKIFRDLWGVGAVAGEASNGSLDLRGANLSVLKEAGILTVYDLNICTCCNNSFGSFRRERETYTRMMAYMGDLTI